MTRKARLRLVALLVVVTAALAAAGYWLHRRCGPPPVAYSGDSAGLKDTVVVPTLDTPTPKGKNVIWCSSFQAAWNRLKNDVVKVPVRVKNAGKVAARLNAAPQSETDLPEGAYYSAAGFAASGIAETIRKAMKKRFPDVPPPDFGDLGPGDILAYAYLAANVKFEIPFFENREEFLFNGKTSVSSFGIRRKDDYAYGELREQVEILYMSEERGPDYHTAAEFVIDPCKTSKPCQIVLALINPKPTLEETLNLLHRQAAGYDTERYARRLNPVDVLLVPNIRYEITHRFKELEGPDKLLLNKGFEGYYVQTAEQVINFKLDRSGAELSSQAKSRVEPVARHFIFDRPFLICMKKRGGKHPFFVMWVENAELLCKR